MALDVKVIEEENGYFRVYVDNRPAIELPTQIEAEKLAAFLRQQSNGSMPAYTRSNDPDDDLY